MTMTYEDSGLYKAMLSAAFEQGRTDFATKVWNGYLIAHEQYGREDSNAVIEAASDFLKDWDGLNEEAVIEKVIGFNVAEEDTEDLIRLFEEPEDVGYTQPRVWQLPFAIRRAINEGRLAGWREILQDTKRILKNG